MLNGNVHLQLPALRYEVQHNERYKLDKTLMGHWDRGSGTQHVQVVKIRLEPRMRVLHIKSHGRV